MDASSPARRGRPPGEQTPEGLIRAELLAHLRLYRRLREIVETKVQDAASLDVDALTKYMELLRKGITEMAKPIVPQAKSETRQQEQEENASSILARLVTGEGIR
jgi:hypothetical protein